MGTPNKIIRKKTWWFKFPICIFVLKYDLIKCDLIIYSDLRSQGAVNVSRNNVKIYKHKNYSDNTLLNFIYSNEIASDFKFKSFISHDFKIVTNKF